MNKKALPIYGVGPLYVSVILIICVTVALSYFVGHSVGTSVHEDPDVPNSGKKVQVWF